MVRREAGDGVWPPGRRTLVRAARASVRGLPGRRQARPSAADRYGPRRNARTRTPPRCGLERPSPAFPVRSVVLATLAQVPRHRRDAGRRWSLRGAKLSSEVLRHRPALGRRPGRVVRHHPRGLPVPRQHHVGRRRPPASALTPDRHGPSGRSPRSTPAARAAAWNRRPTICGESGTTRSSGPRARRSAQRPDGVGDVALHEPHVPRLALRVRLPAADRHQHPVAGGRRGDVGRRAGTRPMRLTVFPCASSVPVRRPDSPA